MEDTFIFPLFMFCFRGPGLADNYFVFHNMETWSILTENP